MKALVRQSCRANQKILCIAGGYSPNSCSEVANTDFRRGSSSPILRPINAVHFGCCGCLGLELPLGICGGLISNAIHAYSASTPRTGKSRPIAGYLTHLFAENSVLGSHLHGEVKDWHNVVETSLFSQPTVVS